MTVVLRPMTEQEFAERNTVLIDRYADDLRESGRVSAVEAHEESVRQNTGFLPQGIDTPGMLLFMAEADGQSVGWLWVGPTIKPDLPEQAWIYNIEVNEEHRSKGYGRAILEAVERELGNHGYTKIGLNVFGSNTVAIRLYESLGFEVTAQQMAKPLTPTGTA
ncbi:N-acetyltransferase family protein [Micromonospora sp. NPDC003197]